MRIIARLIVLFLLSHVIAAFAGMPSSAPASKQSDYEMENLSEQNGAYTIKRGPNCEGVVYMWGDAETFHNTPWLDSATITRGWGSVEKEDQVFDFSVYDKVLEEVRKYNREHPGAHRTMHVRMVGGRYAPKWIEDKGARFYDTTSFVTSNKPIHIPVPYDNPVLMKQLRELYQATYEHFKDAPEVICYHGTWAGGPWEEIFHPRGDEPLPPDYSQEKFMKGMMEQLDILIDEYCMKGKIAEISYSGLYPSKEEFDITGPLTMRMVQRLGKRSPYLYVNSDGWGYVGKKYQVSAGHNRDMADIFGLVNISLQAIGDNYGTKPARQGDWPTLMETAKKFDANYIEIYASDVGHLDSAHRIVQAFDQTEEQANSGKAGSIPGYLGFRPWLKQRDLHLYEREGVLHKSFKTQKPMYFADLQMKADLPISTVITTRVRTRLNGGEWTDWVETHKAFGLSAGNEIELEAKLHTDDGYYTPRLYFLEPVLSEIEQKAPLDDRPAAVQKRKAGSEPASSQSASSQAASANAQ